MSYRILLAATIALALISALASAEYINPEAGGGSGDASAWSTYDATSDVDLAGYKILGDGSGLTNLPAASGGPIVAPTFAPITGYTSTIPIAASVVIIATNDPVAAIEFGTDYAIAGYTNAFVDLTIIWGATNALSWNTAQVDGSWAFLNLSRTDPNYVFATKRGTNLWSLMRDLP